MKEPRQRVMEEIGKEGCYVLALVDIAEEVMDRRIDAVVAYLYGVENGHLRENCLVKNGAGFLKMLTGFPWTKRYEGAAYQAKLGEYVVEKWKRKSGSGTVEHFRRPCYDPYGDSKTVREGWLDSKRIYVRV